MDIEEREQDKHNKHDICTENREQRNAGCVCAGLNGDLGKKCWNVLSWSHIAYTSMLTSRAAIPKVVPSSNNKLSEYDEFLSVLFVCL